jgi:CubicO group peptidase (beta-lactamase class C family)
MRRTAIFSVFVAGLLATTFAAAQGLPTAKPEEVGLSSARLARLTQALNDDLAKGTLPGAIVLIVRDGKVAYHETFGMQNPDAKTPMSKDAIFRIYSMTKPIVSVAALMLVEEGKISLGDPVAKYIPQFKDVKVGVEKPGADGKPTLDLVAPRRPVTVQDLLRHSAGLTYGVFGTGAVKQLYQEAKLFDGDPDNAEFAERVAKLPLMFQPGSTWEYSHATDILGRVVEVAAGKSLYATLKEKLLDPLGMPDTSFYVTEQGKQARIAEPFSDDRAIGAGIAMNDPRQAGKWESGGGGMVGTANDYARFLQMLLNGGTLDGKRYLSPKTIAYMTSDHLGDKVVPGPAYLPGDGYGFGLGFAVRKADGQAMLPGTEGDYSWGGAGGTFFWVDPKERMFVVYMMQSPKQRLYYRNVLKNMVYGAFERSMPQAPVQN